MKHRHFLAALAISASLVVAGCGDEGETTSTPRITVIPPDPDTTTDSTRE